MKTIMMFLLLMMISSPVLAEPTVPLLNGKCNEYDRLKSTSHKLSPDVTLFVFQDRSYVWLCYNLPADSYGTLDLKLTSPGLDAPLNLHISAQLGEWPAEQPDLAPQSAESDLWWQIEGWWANAVSFNGTDSSGEKPRTAFLPSAGREMQLSKERFGRGTWALKFEIGAVQGADGERYSIQYPAENEPEFTLQVD